MKKYFLFAALLAAVPAMTAAPSYAEVNPGKLALVREADLRASMQRLFSDHITWQRTFAVETLTGARDVNKAKERLNKNVTDIGGAFDPFYGPDNGARVTDLLKQHIQLLAGYAIAAKGGMDTRPLKDQLTTNADGTAELLSTLNPAWKKDDLSALFRQHAKDMIAEIDLQVKDRGALDVRQMDASSDHGAEIADTIANGIMKQHAEKLK